MGVCRWKVVSLLVYGVIVAVNEALATIRDCDDDEDGRSHRRPPARRFSKRRSFFSVADNDRIFVEGWLKNQFRCTKESFNTICEIIENN